MRFRFATFGSALLLCALAAGPVVVPALAQSRKGKPAAAQSSAVPAPQKVDEE